jgi:hypothetical protein
VSGEEGLGGPTRRYDIDANRQGPEATPPGLDSARNDEPLGRLREKIEETYDHGDVGEPDEQRECDDQP